MYIFIKTVKINKQNNFRSEIRVYEILKITLKQYINQLDFGIAWKEKRRALKSSIRLMLKTLIAIYS